MTPNIKKVLTDGAVLAIAFWVTGLLLNMIKLPFLQAPALDMTNLLGAYLGLVVALYIKEWIAPKLPF